MFALGCGIGEIFACGIWNPGFGIRNPDQAIRNPANDWNRYAESTDKESGLIHSVDIQNPRLFWTALHVAGHCT